MNRLKILWKGIVPVFNLQCFYYITVYSCVPYSAEEARRRKYAWLYDAEKNALENQKQYLMLEYEASSKEKILAIEDGAKDKDDVQVVSISMGTNVVVLLCYMDDGLLCGEWSPQISRSLQNLVDLFPRKSIKFAVTSL